MDKRRVILVTDGDVVAKDVLEAVAKEIGGRCISKSAGNPSPYTGKQIVELISQTPYDPVIVMFDDNGNLNKGEGEKALEYIVNHQDIEVIGVLAVASNTKFVYGIKVDYSIDQNGRIARNGVNKEGEFVKGSLKVYGDTVDVINKLSIPIIMGIGDIGKMEGKDLLRNGSPVTLKAVKTLLEWSDSHEKKYEIKKNRQERKQGR